MSRSAWLDPSIPVIEVTLIRRTRWVLLEREGENRGRSVYTNRRMALGLSFYGVLVVWRADEGGFSFGGEVVQGRQLEELFGVCRVLGFARDASRCCLWLEYLGHTRNDMIGSFV
jgi:hypothetical protein